VNAAPVVALPAQVTGCGSAVLNANTSGINTYLWSTNQTTPAITVTKGGTYSVRVLSNNGCAALDTTAVTMQVAPTALFTFAKGVGLAYTFQDASLDAPTSYFWDFGDPASASNASTSASPVHVFTALGSYFVTLIVRNDCGSDTIVDIVEATTAVDDAVLAQGLVLAPNPTDGIVEATITLEVGFASTISVRVFDMQGQELGWLHTIATGATRSLSLDLSTEAKGVYLVRFETDSDAGAAYTVKKIMVQ